MGHEKVRTDWDSMRTADPNVFAAGDGAFGPSTIVMAMQHGHRAAYYMREVPGGRRRPAALPHAVQDAPRAGRAGRRSGRCSRASTRRSTASAPTRWPSRRSSRPTTRDAARREAARCYRCDAETGSVGLQRAHPRGHLRHGAHEAGRRAEAAGRVHAPPEGRQPGALQPGSRRRSTTSSSCPANLSRLVIDPYRDACSVDTRSAPGLDLAAPFLVTGLRRRPASRCARPSAARCRAPGWPRGPRAAWARRALAAGRRGRRGRPDPRAAAVIVAFRDGFRPVAPQRARDGPGARPRGRAAPISRRRSRSRWSTSSTCWCSRPTRRWRAPGRSSPARPTSSVVRDAMRIMRAAQPRGGPRAVFSAACAPAPTRRS